MRRNRWWVVAAATGAVALLTLLARSPGNAPSARPPRREPPQVREDPPEPAPPSPVVAKEPARPSALEMPPRPSPDVEADWRSLSRWLLDELSDADFARLLRGTEIEGYFAAIVSRLLDGPRESGAPPPEMTIFLDRFNQRVVVCEPIGVSLLEAHP